MFIIGGESRVSERLSDWLAGWLADRWCMTFILVYRFICDLATIQTTSLSTRAYFQWIFVRSLRAICLHTFLIVFFFNFFFKLSEFFVFFFFSSLPIPHFKIVLKNFDLSIYWIYHHWASSPSSLRWHRKAKIWKHIAISIWIEILCDLVNVFTLALCRISNFWCWCAWMYVVCVLTGFLLFFSFLPKTRLRKEQHIEKVFPLVRQIFRFSEWQILLFQKCHFLF